MVKRIDFKRVTITGVVGVVAMTMAACSTTQTVKVAQAAPITYKIDQSALRSASVQAPTMPPLSTLPQSRPSYTIPSPYTPQGRPAPRSKIETPASQGSVPFEKSKVDRDLYKHQRVGKRYSIMGQSYTPKHDPNYDKKGLASWYGDKFHGKPTATGEIYNKNDMTAAHKTLPLNSMLHVTNLDNGRSIMVRLNDRGPFVGDRIIDLSEAAARALGTVEQGVGRVRVRYVGPADPMAPQRLVEAPRPVPVPRPTPQPVPQNTAPAPQAPLEYQPLRQQQAPGVEAARPAPLPQTVPQSAPQDYTPQEYAPYEPAPQMAPKAAEPLPTTPEAEDDDEVITLTIKGPIHMAKSSTTQKKAEWIDAVNRRQYPTVK